ncbi:dual OB domain-containing protein [Cupriavidus taiwanensis]|nr:hypothetical protein [Cupriavidus taiwanensis]
MTKIIITDLTRFQSHGLLCTAGIDVDTGELIRPMRAGAGGRHEYLHYDVCKKHTILPGAILEADFSKPVKLNAPHIEDRLYTTIRYLGACTSEEFESILQRSTVESIKSGFAMTAKDKVIPVGTPCPASIITINIDPAGLRVVEDNYGKIRAHVTDKTGAEYSFLSITDLGFFDNVGNPDKRKMSVAEANAFVRSQDRVYVRVGLSRIHEARGRSGYWLQVNGIYTFPNFSQIIRSY